MSKRKASEKLRTQRRLLVTSVLALALIAFSLVAPLLCQHDPVDANLSFANLAPNDEYLMGTDSLGRCVLCRVLSGLQTTIFSALLVVVASAVIGSVVGSLSGYVGGAFDSVVMRITDAFMAFPALVLGIAIAGLLGGGLNNAIIALVVPGWTRFARLARSSVLSLKERPFVLAAIMSGLSKPVIALRHVLPNILPPLVVMACLDVGGSMLNLAGLSFLGLGASPPSPELGAMINQASNTMQTTPWAVFAPGAVILIVVVILNLFGDAVNDVLGKHHVDKVRVKSIFGKRKAYEENERETA